MKQFYFIVVLAYYLFPSISFAGSQVYTIPGTYSFTVPQRVTNVSAIISGGGGGGGGSDGYGDNHAGGGGGSGGYMSINVDVQSGENLTIIVGAGGLPAFWIFNDSYFCSPSGTTMTKNGANGFNSSLSGSFGTYTVTGGQGGGGNTSDSGNGWSGAGGAPGGVAGGIIDNRRNEYCFTPGGSVISYGTGGNSNGWTGCSGNPPVCPVAGVSGLVQIWWTDPPVVDVYFSLFIKKIKSFFAFYRDHL